MGRSKTLAAAAIGMALTGDAAAGELWRQGDYAMAVGLWGQAGLAQTFGQGEDYEYTPYLSMARLLGHARHKRWGFVLVQFEALSGTAELLDARIEFTPIKPLAVKMGLLRVPTSDEFQVLAPATPFVNRPMLSSGFLSSRAMGVEVAGTHETGAFLATLQASIFSPSFTNTTGGELDMQVASLRGLIRWDSGVHLHAAYADVIALTDPTGLNTLNTFIEDARADVAVGYMKHGWQGEIEGTVAVNSNDATTPWAMYAQAAKKWDLKGENLAIEGGGRYDASRDDDITRHRITYGGNLYFLDHDRLQVSLNHELWWTDGVPSQAIYAQLQMGWQ